MLRHSLIVVLLAFALGLPGEAIAQRSGAKIVQGVTSVDLATTADQMRAASAEMGARLSGLEADNARLAGKVETLEFLLSQSRDQINDMQADDAEIGRLIAALERQLADQASDLNALKLKMDMSEARAAQLAVDEMVSERPLNTANEGFEGADIMAPEVTSTRTVTTDTGGGPTRIVPRVSVSEAVEPGDQIRGGGAQGSLGTLPASALPGEAGPLFAAAKSRLLQFDYAGAEAAFRSFLEQFGDDPQAGEAQYWLGEALYQQEAYAESGQAYTQMIRQYPDDPRAPEALAKLARSMRLVGDTEQACNALDILVRRYPDASGVTRNLAAGERVRAGCDN